MGLDDVTETFFPEGFSTAVGGFPDAIRAQMEGAAVMGLSVAFNERVEFNNGGVSTSNFDEYPLLSFSQVPEVEVHIVDSRHGIGGIGEPGIPAVAPAVANALFAATGVRLRQLPFNMDVLFGDGSEDVISSC